MIYIKTFTFNAFQENTFVVYNDNKESIIIDPGCSNSNEQDTLIAFIESEELMPVRLINTHCHIDHVLGNSFIAEKYNLKLEAHSLEKEVLNSCEMVSKMYGIPYDKSPDIGSFIKEGEKVKLGDEHFDTLLCPGHSPGSLCFFHEESKTLIGGDVLFMSSIGRTDLPGGDHDTLIRSIKEKVFALPDDTTVYPGHGPTTSIGIEKKTNPFLT